MLLNINDEGLANQFTLNERVKNQDLLGIESWAACFLEEIFTIQDLSGPLIILTSQRVIILPWCLKRPTGL